MSRLFRVTFTDFIEAESQEDCYEKMKDYLERCANARDVEAFEFEEVTGLCRDCKLFAEIVTGDNLCEFCAEARDNAE